MTRLWDDDLPFWDDDSAVWDEEETPTMSNNDRRYRFADSLLYSESGLIIAAAEADAAVTARLPAGAVADAADLLDDAQEATGGQQNNSTELDGLTTAQDNALATIRQKTTLARETAKKAFRGQTTKLREQFGVGDIAKSLAQITALALKIHAGATDADNTAALATKGWTAADSTALETAILSLTGADTLQEARKASNKGGTMDYVALNNSLYDAVLAIQNAAAIEHPGTTSADIVARQTFRIGIFPPVQNRAVPTIPRKLKAYPQAPASLTLKIDWNKSTRADDYLGTIKNKTTGDLITTFETEDNQTFLTLTGTPAGTQITIELVARNDLGSSKTAGPITATVP